MPLKILGLNPQRLEGFAARAAAVTGAMPVFLRVRHEFPGPARHLRVRIREELPDPAQPLAAGEGVGVELHPCECLGEVAAWRGCLSRKREPCPPVLGKLEAG